MKKHAQIILHLLSRQTVQCFFAERYFLIVPSQYLQVHDRSWSFHLFQVKEYNWSGWCLFNYFYDITRGTGFWSDLLNVWYFMKNLEIFSSEVITLNFLYALPYRKNSAQSKFLTFSWFWVTVCCVHGKKKYVLGGFVLVFMGVFELKQNL